MILPVVVVALGIVTGCEPSFGVPANRVVHVFPLSVDQRISTLAVFTPLAVVPATSHVTVCELPPAYVVAVFCEVTRNGPAVELTVITASSELFPEPPALLSRTVNLKFNVLATEERASTVIAVPAVVVAPVNIDAILGKYLTGEVVGVHDLKLGPEAFVALAAELAPV